MLRNGKASRTSQGHRDGLLGVTAGMVVVAILGACGAENYSPTASNKQLALSESKASMNPLVRQAGCIAAIQVSPGSVRIARILPAELPFQLPDLGAAARESRAPNVLRPVVLIARPDGNAGPVSVVCIGSIGRRFERQAQASVAASMESPRWIAVTYALRAGPEVHTDKPAAVVAAAELRLLVFPRLRDTQTTARSEWVPWESDTGTAKPPTPLPPITVTASRDTWWVDELFFRSRALRQRSLQDVVNWDYVYYDGPDCADFSELFIANDEMLDRWEEEAALDSLAIASLEEFNCEPKPGFKICLDFHIQSRRSFVFGGDDRDYNNLVAGISQSRAMFFFNPDSIHKKTQLINSTKIKLGGYEKEQYTQNALFKPDSDYVISKRGDTIHVKIVAYNNFCSSRENCPTIDAEVFFIPDAASTGGYKVGWKRDAYPTMTIKWSSNNGGNWTHIMAHDPENGWGPYLAWTALIAKWRQSIHMPPQCELQ